MKNSYCWNSINGCQVITNFCTCHDSTAFMSHAKFYNDWMTEKQSFNRIIRFVKWIPKHGRAYNWQRLHFVSWQIADCLLQPLDSCMETQYVHDLSNWRALLEGRRSTCYHTKKSLYSRSAPRSFRPKSFSPNLSRSAPTPESLCPNIWVVQPQHQSPPAPVQWPQILSNDMKHQRHLYVMVKLVLKPKWDSE